MSPNPTTRITTDNERDRSRSVGDDCIRAHTDLRPVAESSTLVCDDDSVIASAGTPAPDRVPSIANEPQTCTEYVNAVMAAVMARSEPSAGVKECKG